METLKCGMLLRCGGLQEYCGGFFVLIEAAVRNFQQFLCCAAVFGVDGDADAYGEARRFESRERQSRMRAATCSLRS